MGWEYLVSDFVWTDETVFVDGKWISLDEVGKLGWELVTITKRPGEDLQKWVFKRPIRNN